MALLTMTATWVDGGYLLGTAEGAFKTNVASGVQGGLCFGISLILGGIFFSKRMRQLGFHTLIDPFESRFGKRWAAVLFIPAMLAEVFWSAELLVAIGSSFDVILGIRLTSAILLAALVVTVYTMMGGLWSVAYTDAFQLGIVALGLLVALPFILGATGGLGATRRRVSARQSALVEPFRLDARRPRLVGRGAHAGFRRHSVELLFPARALLPHAARRAAHVDLLRPADHGVRHSAAAGRHVCRGQWTRRSTIPLRSCP